MGRRYAGRARTTWRRMTEKEGGEELGWKSWKEAPQVAIKRREWPRIDKPLCVTKVQIVLIGDDSEFAPKLK